ncbi:MAG: LysR family transcriptional regulator [Rhizobiaceae bacterium]|nr:LysR family transcriptional regulator [Rhizobiaceae bacterium]
MKLSKRFPLNAMLVFEAVARHGSFTRAGEELGMTQTAVSYQIKLLEENIGEPLFLRQPRQIELTDIACRMLPNVTRGFELLTEAVDAARQNVSDTLDIHSSPTFGSHWLSRRLGGFQLQHPGMAVRLLRVSKFTDFSRDRADVAIRWGFGPWEGLDCHLLGQLIYAPMVSPAYLDRVGGISSPEDLQGLTMIGARDDCWRHWFAAAGVANPDLSSQTSFDYREQDLCANAAISGQGVAILDRLYFYDELQAGRLIEPFDTYCSEGHGIWLIYPKNRRNQPKVRAFREWILEAVRNDIARTAPD